MYELSHRPRRANDGKVGVGAPLSHRIGSIRPALTVIRCYFRPAAVEC